MTFCRTIEGESGISTISISQRPFLNLGHDPACLLVFCCVFSFVFRSGTPRPFLNLVRISNHASNYNFILSIVITPRVQACLFCTIFHVNIHD